MSIYMYFSSSCIIFFQKSQSHPPTMLPSWLLLSLLLLLLLLLELVTSQVTENFVFNGGFNSTNLRLNDQAVLLPGGLVRLTNNSKQAMGHAFYPDPFRFKGAGETTPPSSFSTNFVFAIVPEYSDVSGHGIAFVLSPARDLAGAQPSQHLGLFNLTSNGDPKSHILAVEFDTVKNAEFNDIDDNHVGIDVNNLTSQIAEPVTYFQDGVKKNLSLNMAEPIQAWVEFDGPTGQLNVTVAPINAPKPQVPLLSWIVKNFSSVVLDKMYVGFSASTGAAPENHYLLGWSFQLNGKAEPLDLSRLPRLPSQGTSNKKSQGTLIVALFLAAVIILLVGIAGVIFLVKRKRKYAELLEDWEQEYGPHRFSYKDLFRATKGFKEENFVGVGGFGRVYRGVLPKSKIEIAVKKVSHGSSQGMREFVAEIASMGRLRHRNLVQLLGYCRRQGELLLVYDYMPNGSLDRFLFDRSTDNLGIGWKQRFHIIRGVASGLLYLHDGWEQVVVHRDIKASNVLLDAELNGKLGDFGLARLYDHGTNPQTTHVVGTLGYIAPELTKTGKATTSSDVYAFGAFLLEVATGRRPMEMHATAEVPVLVDFVYECWKAGSIVEAADRCLGEDHFDVEEIELVLRLGLLCSQPEPAARPSMRQVVQFLEGDAPMPAMSPKGFDASSTAIRRGEGFDDFVMSYASMSSYTTMSFADRSSSSARNSSFFSRSD